VVVAMAFHVLEAKHIIEEIIDVAEDVIKAIDLIMALRACDKGWKKRGVLTGSILNQTAIAELAAKIKIPADLQERIALELGIADLSKPPENACPVDHVLQKFPQQRYCLCHDHLGHAEATTCEGLDELPVSLRGNVSWANVPCVPVVCKPRNESMVIRYINVSADSISHNVASNVISGISKELVGVNASQIVAIEPASSTNATLIAIQVDPAQVPRLESLSAVTGKDDVVYNIAVVTETGEKAFVRSPWFIVVIVAACVVGCGLLALAVIMILRYRNERHDSSSESYNSAN